MPVNLLAQGYFQITSGVSGQKLAVGFSLDGANSHKTMEITVPAFLPHGINIFDHYVYKPGYVHVPPGEHTLSLWAINRDGTPMTIEHRQVQFLALDASRVTTDPSGGTSIPAEEMITAYNDATKIIEMAGDGSRVLDPFFTHCDVTNPWSELLRYTYRARAWPDMNFAGDGYIEFVNTMDPAQFLEVDVGVEVLLNPQLDASGQPTSAQATADFTITSLKIPPGRHQKFFFTHPMLWHVGKDNLIRLMVRKHCGSPPGRFTIGKRFMGIRGVHSPYTQCWKD